MINQFSSDKLEFSLISGSDVNNVNLAHSDLQEFEESCNILEVHRSDFFAPHRSGISQRFCRCIEN